MKHVRKVNVIWVAPLWGDGRRTERAFQPECSCGWKGSVLSSAPLAHRDFRRHASGPVVEAA